MFNFTTQTIYNKIVASTITGEGQTPAKGANLIINTNGKNPYLRIGNTRFDKDLIKDIYVKKPTVGSLTRVDFHVSNLLNLFNTDASLPNEITARIVLYVGLSMNCQDAFYANDYVYKGKPLFIEFPVKKNETAENLAKKIVSIADKYQQLIMGEKVLNIRYIALTNGIGPGVVIEGTNCYQQIKKAVLQWYNPKAKTVDCCTMDGDYVDLVTGYPEAYTTKTSGEKFGEFNKYDGHKWVMIDGKKVKKSDFENGNSTIVCIRPGIEPFGDYNWLIHNLRLPTLANTNFWSPAKHMGELPIPDAAYWQIIIRIEKEREGIAGGIVGAAVKSVTTHVLYVNQNSVETVLQALTAMNVSDKIHYDADETLKDPLRLGVTGDVTNTDVIDTGAPTSTSGQSEAEPYDEGGSSSSE